MNDVSHRLIILAGPSCVGKSPLVRALARIYPERDRSLRQLVLYNSRAPRPGELDGVDYHFRTRTEIEAMEERPDMVVMEVRGDLQALDVGQLRRDLDDSDLLFEGNPLIGDLLRAHDGLGAVPRVSVFLAPVSRAELREISDPAYHLDPRAVITDLMRRKLLRRLRRHKGEPSLPDLENVERRAGNAYRELQMACAFEHVLPCQDGEDSDNWDAFYLPLGAAGRVLRAFVAILDGETPDLVERWPDDLLP